MLKVTGISIIILMFSSICTATPSISDSFCKSGNSIYYKNRDACKASLGSDCPTNLFSSFIREMEYIHLDSETYILRAYIAPKSNELENCTTQSAPEGQAYAESHRMAYPDEKELIVELLENNQPLLGVNETKQSPSENLNRHNFELVDTSRISSQSSKTSKDNLSDLKPAGGEFAGGGIVLQHSIEFRKEETQDWLNGLPDQKSDEQGL